MQIDWLSEWGYSTDSIAPQSAYIHVPFCRHRCGYCNFSLLANRDDLFERYLNAIAIELSGVRTPQPMGTLFFGGGTPSILPVPQMTRLLQDVRAYLPPMPDAEWSIEVNPLDVTDEKCELWSQHGINRISIGGQSFHSNKLKQLERDHSGESLRESIRIAQRHFANVSLDLIFAAPNESMATWTADIDQAIHAGVTHISTYGLTYEKGAKFWARRERNELQSLDEELELRMYEHAIDRLTAAGFVHYEVSNFARPGWQCMHNQAYWTARPWWAFGPSAARFVGTTRSVNHRGTLQYIRSIEHHQSPIFELERLTPEQQLRERFVFGMRQLSGVDWNELSRSAEPHVRDSITSTIERHVEHGWMTYDSGIVKLTRAGLMVSDSLWSDYL